MRTEHDKKYNVNYFSDNIDDYCQWLLQSVKREKCSSSTQSRCGTIWSRWWRVIEHVRAIMRFASTQ